MKREVISNKILLLGLDYIAYNIDSRNCKAEQLWNVFAEKKSCRRKSGSQTHVKLLAVNQKA